MLMPSRVNTQIAAGTFERTFQGRQYGGVRRIWSAGVEVAPDNGQQLKRAVSLTRHIKKGGKLWIRIFPTSYQ